MLNANIWIYSAISFGTVQFFDFSKDLAPFPAKLDAAGYIVHIALVEILGVDDDLSGFPYRIAASLGFPVIALAPSVFGAFRPIVDRDSGERALHDGDCCAAFPE